MAVSVPAVWFITRDGVTVEQAAAAQPAPAAAAPQEPKEMSFWSTSTKVKATPRADRAPVELGMRFTAARSGWVAGVRFYKAPGDKGKHTGSLWSAGGKRLARVTFDGESASGWQEARFASPVRLKAKQLYTVSYHSAAGNYVGSRGFDSARSGPLTMTSRNAGVFGYGRSTFPDRWNAKGYNYWVDVIFRWRDRSPAPVPTGPSQPSQPPQGPGETPVPSPTPSTGATPGTSSSPSQTADASPGPGQTGTGPSPSQTGTGPSPSQTTGTSPSPSQTGASPSSGSSQTAGPGPSTSTSPSATMTGTPRPTPTSRPTLTPRPTPTPRPTLTPKPTPTPRPTLTPKPTPTPRPTLTPKPTPTPRPTLTPGPTLTPRPDDGGSSCAGHPTPACTGVPAGTQLRRSTLNEDGAAYRVTKPGTVLDGVHIPGDLLIHAENVTVRNSQIDGGVINADGPRTYRFTITDSTIGPAQGCKTLPGIGQDKYTALRVHVRNHGDGFRASGDDVVIRDSYANLCSNPGDHSDGIQTYNTGKGLVFDHNTIDQRHAKDVTAPIFLVDKQIVDAVVTDNLVMGGTYSIQLKNARGKLVVRDNKLVDDSWIYGPVEADCHAIDWAGNSLVKIDQNYRITSVVGPLECDG
ncbi:DUF4082 domain-containing protein [Streptosporangium canum]|uniref:DUF4082 domain-containing protein n=1 Tax=Streptosporangium canum TaxID=324952 RepID=UPI0034228384